MMYAAVCVAAHTHKGAYITAIAAEDDTAWICGGLGEG